MALLSVRNLNVAIGDAPVLKDVSLDIEPGSIFGVVGESGSGKSMAALSIMGLLPEGAVRTGSAELDGRNLFDLGEREMCAIRGGEIGMIFQEPMSALNPVKTIGDQVAETLLVHGKMNAADAREVSREKLDRVGMPENRFPLDLYPHQLSGGQRQRVCIALAVALRPKLLIADEPTTALDVSTQIQILRLLESLVRDERMSLMLITHDLAVVAGMADFVSVMENARIVEAAETESLFRRMRHPYTKKLFRRIEPRSASALRSCRIAAAGGSRSRARIRVAQNEPVQKTEADKGGGQRQFRVAIKGEPRIGRRVGLREIDAHQSHTGP